MRHFQKRGGRVKERIWCREWRVRPSRNSRCEPPSYGSQNRIDSDDDIGLLTGITTATVARGRRGLIT
jgi:hypothetical protein